MTARTLEERVADFAQHLFRELRKREFGPEDSVAILVAAIAPYTAAQVGKHHVAALPRQLDR